MPIVYSRSVAYEQATQETLALVEEEVRAHCSAVVDPDDDEQAYADGVEIERVEDHDGDGNSIGVKVVGRLDAEPDAPYLKPGFDPDADTQHSFTPYENPDDGEEYDRDAFEEFQRGEA